MMRVSYCENTANLGRLPARRQIRLGPMTAANIASPGTQALAFLGQAFFLVVHFVSGISWSGHFAAFALEFDGPETDLLDCPSPRAALHPYDNLREESGP